ncbi:MAG: DNA repair protein RadC, partial [Erysipelothrix sp.]|nr:DNA repair protein RadC [Erysipelothrix sp.]
VLKMKIKEMEEETRPREKAALHGVESLSDRELLALFIRFGTRKKSALEIADEVLHLSGGMSRFMKLNRLQLMMISGIKEAKATELMAIVEMGKRLIRPTKDSDIFVSEPSRLMEWLNFEIGYKEQEHFMVVFLNNQNMIVGHELLFKGTIDRSVVHPRDVFREGVSLNATRVILVHNHPGGTMKASQADLHVTQVMHEAGLLVGIEVLDHLIVSGGNYLSIRMDHPELFE